MDLGTNEIQIEEVSENSVESENGDVQRNTSTKNELPKEQRYHRNHSKENMLTDPSEGRVIRSGLRKMIRNVAFVSQIEPKVFEEAWHDENQMMAMQEELNINLKETISRNQCLDHQHNL